MNNKPTPDITPNLAISAYHVLQQYCTGQPADCKGCGFYEHCPECFQGIPCDWSLNEEGEINEVKKGNITECRRMIYRHYKVTCGILAKAINTICCRYLSNMHPESNHKSMIASSTVSDIERWRRSGRFLQRKMTSTDISVRSWRNIII